MSLGVILKVRGTRKMTGTNRSPKRRPAGECGRHGAAVAAFQLEQIDDVTPGNADIVPAADSRVTATRPRICAKTPGSTLGAGMGH